MNVQIDLRGASGALYRYRMDNPARPANAAGGNFVYVRETPQETQVLFAGETDSLARADFERWGQAVAEHGATHLFTRLNVSLADRSRELEDLIAALEPVMNRSSAGPAALPHALPARATKAA
jgi:hypothetical protein